MARQEINIGTTPNDGTGDSIRASFGKVNDNSEELYNKTIADVAFAHTYVDSGDEVGIVLTANTAAKYQLNSTVRLVNNFEIQEIGTTGTFALFYTGSRDITCSLAASSSAEGTTNNSVIKTMVYKNGTQLDGAEVDRKISTGGDIGSVALATSFELVTGDYLDLYVESDNATTLTFLYTNIVIREV